MINNPMNMMQQFSDFKKSIDGKDPQAILDNMLNTGQVTKEQVEKATEMAKQFQSLFK